MRSSLDQVFQTRKETIKCLLSIATDSDIITKNTVLE